MRNLDRETAWCDALVEKTSNKVLAQLQRVASLKGSDAKLADELRILTAMRVNASAAKLNREMIRS